MNFIILLNDILAKIIRIIYNKYKWGDNMNKTMKKILILIAIVLVFMFMTGMVYAGDINPDDFNPGNPSSIDVNEYIKIANPIIGTIKTVGIVIAVVTMTVLGIKYMTASIEEKATYKKTMIPYIVGVFLVVAITQFLGVLIEIISDI